MSKGKMKVKKFKLDEQDGRSFHPTANAHMILKSFPTVEELATQNLSPEDFFEAFKENCVYAFAAKITLIRVTDSSSLVAILGDKVIALAPWFETELLQKEKRYVKRKKFPNHGYEKDGFEDDDDDHVDEDEEDFYPEEKRYAKRKKVDPKYQVDEKDGFEDDDDDHIDENEEDWDDDELKALLKKTLGHGTSLEGILIAISSLTEAVVTMKQRIDNQESLLTTHGTMIVAQDNNIKVLYDSVRSLQDSVIKPQSPDETKH